MSWKLKRTKQCDKCPWRKDVNPHTIPNDYSVEKHRSLSDTIAEPASLKNLTQPITAMACHETNNAHCVGWLMHQLGPGNNIPLRIRVLSCDNIKKVRLVGEQHKAFEDTLPPEES